MANFDQDLVLISLGSHAIALRIACDLLSQAQPANSSDEWLALIMARARVRYESMPPGEFRATLQQIITAMGGSESL